MVDKKTRDAFLADVIFWDFFFSDRLHNLRSRNSNHFSILASKIAGVGDQAFSCCLNVPMQVNRATEEKRSEPDQVERNIVEIV